MGCVCVAGRWAGGGVWHDTRTSLCGFPCQRTHMYATHPPTNIHPPAQKCAHTHTRPNAQIHMHTRANTHAPVFTRTLPCALEHMHARRWARTSRPRTGRPTRRRPARCWAAACLRPGCGAGCDSCSRTWERRCSGGRGGAEGVIGVEGVGWQGLGPGGVTACAPLVPCTHPCAHACIWRARVPADGCALHITVSSCRVIPMSRSNVSHGV